MPSQQTRSLEVSPIRLAERWHAILSSHLDCPFPTVFLVISPRTPSRYSVSFHRGQLRRHDGTLLPFPVPSIGGGKVTSAFDGSLISSDGGVLLLAGAARLLGLIETLAAVIPDGSVQTLGVGTFLAPAGDRTGVGMPGLLAVLQGPVLGYTPKVWTVPLLKNLRETIARQLGGFEAPIRTSATEIEDDQDAPQQSTVDRSDRHSETVERERLRRHRRAARLACSIKSGLSMTQAAPSERLHRSSALVPDVCIAGCVALTCRNTAPWLPSLVRRSNWHGAGRRGQPKSAICSLTYAIVVTRVHTAIWRVSSLPGATTVHRRTGMMQPTRRCQLRCRCM
jgi:hypothetical protein